MNLLKIKIILLFFTYHLLHLCIAFNVQMCIAWLAGVAEVIVAE